MFPITYKIWHGFQKGVILACSCITENSALVRWLQLAACLLSNAKPTIWIPVWLWNPELSAVKRHIKTSFWINKLAGFVTKLSSRKKVSFNPSQVPVVSGNTYQQENTLWQHWSALHEVNASPLLTSILMSLPLHLLCLLHHWASYSFAVQSSNSYSSCSTNNWRWRPGYNMPPSSFDCAMYYITTFTFARKKFSHWAGWVIERKQCL